MNSALLASCNASGAPEGHRAPGHLARIVTEPGELAAHHHIAAVLRY